MLASVGYDACQTDGFKLYFCSWFQPSGELFSGPWVLITHHLDLQPPGYISSRPMDGCFILHLLPVSIIPSFSICIRSVVEFICFFVYLSVNLGIYLYVMVRLWYAELGAGPMILVIRRKFRVF